MLALWLFANSEGVGSARLLERLCDRDAPYRWICGGVPVNHHTLSDFRVKQGKKLDGLLTQTLAALMKQGVLQLKRVAQDGRKVRALACAGSFKRSGPRPARRGARGTRSRGGWPTRCSSRATAPGAGGARASLR